MKQTVICTLLIYAGILGLMSSCAKDETTLPAAVNLQLEHSSDHVDVGARKNADGIARIGAKNTIRIESAQYRIAEMSFEGYRENGQDYFFNREFGDGLTVAVSAGRSAGILSFDMPQGVYERIGISLHLKRSNKGSAQPYNKEAAIIMEGYYLNNKEEEVPLIFVYDYDETLVQTARHAGGSKSIAVSQSQQNEASIAIDLTYWLQLINGRMLQGAKLTAVDGLPTIIISEDHNEHIFDLLSSRINNATHLTFR